MAWSLRKIIYAQYIYCIERVFLTNKCDQQVPSGLQHCLPTNVTNKYHQAYNINTSWADKVTNDQQYFPSQLFVITIKQKVTKITTCEIRCLRKVDGVTARYIMT